MKWAEFHLGCQVRSGTWLGLVCQNLEVFETGCFADTRRTFLIPRKRLGVCFSFGLFFFLLLDCFQKQEISIWLYRNMKKVNFRNNGPLNGLPCLKFYKSSLKWQICCRHIGFTRPYIIFSSCDWGCSAQQTVFYL